MSEAVADDSEVEDTDSRYGTGIPDQNVRDRKALSLLKKGPDRWIAAFDADKYPFDVSEYSPCFDRFEIRDINFQGISFYGSFRNSKLIGCYFEGGDFDSVDFSDAYLESCHFSDVGMTSAKFERAKIQNCSFLGCNLEDAWLQDSDVRETSFDGSILEEASFAGAILHDVSLRHTRCRWSIFDNARMFGTSFRGADLTDCSFEDTHIPGRPSYMSRTSFLSKGGDDFDEDDVNENSRGGADFANSFFWNATLDDTDLGASDLSNAVFYWCNLTGSDFRDCAGIRADGFHGSDLSGAKLPSDAIFIPIIDRIDKTVSLARPAYLVNMITCGALISLILFSADKRDVLFPVFSVPVERHNFAILGIIQSTLIGAYVNLYLLRIWEAVTKLPTIFPGGVLVPEAISPWTILAPTWLHLRVIREHRRLSTPAGFWVQYIFTLASHYLITPLASLIVIVDLWSSDVGIRIPAIAILAASSFISTFFYLYGVVILRGALLTARNNRDDREDSIKRSAFEKIKRKIRILLKLRKY